MLVMEAELRSRKGGGLEVGVNCSGGGGELSCRKKWWSGGRWRCKCCTEEVCRGRAEGRFAMVQCFCQPGPSMSLGSPAYQ